MNRFHQAMRSLFLKGRKAWMLRVVPWNSTAVLFAISVTILLLLGVHYYMIGQISLGTLFLIYQYTQMLTDPIDALPEGAIGLEFEHVSFGYNADKLVLKDINFSVQPGKRLGIIGRTGSGKSSISRLLLRLYNINNGVIRIGGEDISKLKLSALYQRIGMVTQDVQLFDGTLRDNLTLFNREVTDAYIYETTRRLGLRQWIDAQPQGLDTQRRTHLRIRGTRGTRQEPAFTLC